MFACIFQVADGKEGQLLVFLKYTENEILDRAMMTELIIVAVIIFPFSKT